MDHKSFFLKTFNISQNLTDTEINDLCGNLLHKEVKKGQVIYAKGGDKKIFILISGRVKISEFNAEGNEIIKEVVLPGDIFGDIMLNYENTTSEFAVAVSERVTFYSISQSNLGLLMRSNHTLTLNYIAKVNEKFRSLEDRYLNMITKDVKSRLLYCFKEWAKKESKNNGNKIIVKNTLTHNELASLVSTSRQTVTVILNEWKVSGAITYNRKEIEFTPVMLAS